MKQSQTSQTTKEPDQVNQETRDPIDLDKISDLGLFDIFLNQYKELNRIQQNIWALNLEKERRQKNTNNGDQP